MPRIIRRALLEKLIDLPEVREFFTDFQAMTGLEITFRDELGHEMVREAHQCGLCAFLATSARGRALCARSRLGLLTKATATSAVHRCDAGLQEVAVPMRLAGDTVGYFTFGGFRLEDSGGRDYRRIEHLLQRAGVPVSRSGVEEMFPSHCAFSPEASDALRRLVEMAARQFARKISEHFIAADRPLPPLAHKARRYIVSNGLSERCTLPEVAAACGVSPAHLSRVFHESTGLTITDYLARFRVEHAMDLLRKGKQGIADVAFASGFQSVSQFNRTFKKISGRTPSHVRNPLPPPPVEGGGSRRVGV